MTEYSPSRLFRTRVTAVTQLSPNFIRVTVAADTLRWFGGHGCDQRIKLLLAGAAELPPTSFFDRDVAAWYPEWRELPTSVRGFMRTYTVRATRPELGELDIDFVLHGVHGPASAWAATAQIGTELLLIGPDARAGGPVADTGWKPGAATQLLMAGDETAAPAIAAIVASLGPQHHGEVFIEVPSSRDTLELVAPANLSVTWLGRDGLPAGQLLRTAVHRWGARSADHTPLAPDAAGLPGTAGSQGTVQTPYVWLAGESGTITGLRRHLVREVGIHRTAITFMGYWKLGAAEQN